MELQISEVYGIDETTSDLDMDIYVSEIWRDPRLDFTHLYTCLPSYVMKPDIRDRIWTPKVIITNSRKSEIQRTPHENGHVTLYQDGTSEYRFCPLVAQDFLFQEEFGLTPG